MNKRILGFALPVIGTLLLFGVAFLVLESDRIEHCRQYLVPMEGRVNAYAGAEAEINFSFLDEKNLSEMSQTENIRQVRLVLSDGRELDAESWVLREDGALYRGAAYAARELQVFVTLDESATLKELVLRYPDTEERFFVGTLEICVLPLTNAAASIQVWTTLSGDVGNAWLPGDAQLIDFKESLSFGAFQFSSRGDVRILSIDLGIPGLGVDPGTLRRIPEDFDFGAQMTQDPAYQPYLHIRRTPDAGPAEVALDVGRDAFCLAALATSRDDLGGVGIFCAGPLFRCEDLESGEEFLYGSSGCVRVGIQILDDGLAKELLEKEGL